MKKEYIEKLYYEQLHMFEYIHALLLCEFELYMHDLLLNEKYCLKDFKRELVEPFVFNDKELKMIFKHGSKAINNIKQSTSN